MNAKVRRLKFEQLENKSLLSGNTLVEIVDDTLRIIGNDESNNLVMRDVESGIAVISRGGTVNGEELNFVASKSSFSRVDIRLRGGADSLFLDSLGLDGIDVSIRGGTGDDFFRFLNYSNRRVSRGPGTSVLGGIGNDEFFTQTSQFNFLNVKLGDGNNNLYIDNSRVQKTSYFEMQDGYDTVFLGDNVFNGFTSLETGDGGEFSRIVDSRFNGAFKYTTGRNAIVTPANFTFTGNEVGNGMKVRLGDAENKVVFSNNKIDRNLTIDTDPRGLSAGDADEIRIAVSDIGNDLVVNTGSGDDFVSISRSDVGGKLIVRGFPGNDEIKLRRTDVGANVEISLDDGDDQLLVDHVFAAGDFSITASHGDDLLFLIGCEIAGDTNVRGGTGTNEIYMVYMDFMGNASILNGDGDDYVFAYANSFLSDALIAGGKGVDTYSTGLEDPDQESNLFFGEVEKLNLENGVAVDFREILAEQRLSN